jgi:hypothetical protein
MYTDQDCAEGGMARADEALRWNKEEPEWSCGPRSSVAFVFVWGVLMHTTDEIITYVFVG